jgi:hypothetical protein
MEDSYILMEMCTKANDGRIKPIVKVCTIISTELCIMGSFHKICSMEGGLSNGRMELNIQGSIQRE